MRSSLRYAAPDPGPGPWVWTGAYVAYGLTCLAGALIADEVGIHIAFVGSMLTMSLLACLAPLNITTSMRAGGAGHDLVRRLSIMPVFYLIWRYVHETGLWDRYL